VSWQLSRRDFLGLALGTAAGAALRPAFASTSTEVPLHGLSAFGELKYPPGFDRFDGFHSRHRTGSSTRTSKPSTRSTASWPKAMRLRAWNCVSIR
jgi:microcin C transport system substrate-binding protein